MIDCFKKIRWGNILLSGLIFLIVATIVRQIEVVFAMDYYKMPEYFGVWSKLMMPTAGPPPVSFLLTSLLFSFITGITLATLYEFIKTLLPKGKWQKIFCFTDIVIGLSFIFFTLPSFLLFNLPLTLLVYWLISSIVIFFLSSIIFVKILG